jgi:hypothetical protein
MTEGLVDSFRLLVIRQTLGIVWALAFSELRIFAGSSALAERPKHIKFSHAIFTWSLI